MTVSEMVIAAMVASPATVYLECEGKRYRDAVELTKDHGNRLIRSASVHAGGGIEIELEPQEEFDLAALGLPDMFDDQPAFEPDGLLDGPPPAEEVLGANE